MITRVKIEEDQVSRGGIAVKKTRLLPLETNVTIASRRGKEPITVYRSMETPEGTRSG